jgi:flagellin-specific chaperone FliS
MPYINEETRLPLDPIIDELHRTLVGMMLDDEAVNLEACLNYTITRLLRKCYGNKYSEINDAIGMLGCVTQEFYRTVAAPYEDIKRDENGDITP